MTAAKYGESKSTSHNIQFRWNERDEWARAALEEISQYPKAQRGQVMAEALLAFRGRKVPIRAKTAEILLKLERLESRIERSQQELAELLVNALQGLDLSQYARPGGQTLEDDLGAVIPQDVYNQMFKGVQGKSFEIEDD